MNIKAVLAGTAFNFVSSVVGYVALELVIAILFAGVPRAHLDITILSNVGLALNLIMGIACDFGGGYVAGRVGRQDPALNALLTGALDLTFSAVVLYFLAAYFPWWYTVVCMLMPVPAAYAGGLKASRRTPAPTPRRH